jgi:hypothetical protein
MMKKNNLLNVNKKFSKTDFYVTDDPEKLKLVGSWLLQKNILTVKKISLEF